ncbi:DUF5005 domain-containing protein [Jiangella rhizosphaerae]|uniref:DUF5005 domain-containing protein n=1 Tax=Jiangella rhizosphaerae TaxID=2293569 RepID=A0A418KV88_9ACTN|nr:DUF5005 domain-containing protein [Jiangella rhizosphaerae]RIQ32177.1 DUF5005 domain-containing protein [Jiangella rhizosphaerae]
MVRRPGRRSVLSGAAALAIGGLGAFGPPSTAAPAATEGRSCAEVPEVVSATPDAELTGLFTTYGNDNSELDDWTGADGTYSVPLRDGRVFWVFSDTFLGRVDADGGRSPVTDEGGTTPFINNSFVIQDGDQLSTVYRGSADDPEPLMPPVDGSHWFWAGDAHASGNVIEATYQEYERFGPGAWDWRWNRNVLARYSPEHPDEPLSVHDLPSAAGVSWASAIRRVGPYTYVYGVEDHGSVKYLHVARVRGTSLLGPWEYRTADGWSRDEADSVRVMDGVANEYSVSRHGDQYLLVTHDTTVPLNPEIVAYASCTPYGPFTDKTLLYTTPETGAAGSYGDPNVFTYNAHAHPHIDRDGGLVVSYNVNTFVNTDHYEDVTIYRPRFVTVRFAD